MVRLAATCSRSRSKGRTTKTLIETACVLFRTVAVMITPYFVNAKGRLSENGRMKATQDAGLPMQ